MRHGVPAAADASSNCIVGGDARSAALDRRGASPLVDLECAARVTGASEGVHAHQARSEGAYRRDGRKQGGTAPCTRGHGKAAGECRERRGAGQWQGTELRKKPAATVGGFPSSELRWDCTLTRPVNHKNTHKMKFIQ